MYQPFPSMNFHGGDWFGLVEWLESELEDSYKRLAGLQITEKESDQIRGRVALLRQMIEFPNTVAAFTKPHKE